MTFDNTTYNETSDGSLTGIVEDQQGDISGEMTVDPPLGGTGAFTGTVTDATITFDVTGGAGGGVYTGTVNAQGVLSGTYQYTEPPYSGQIGTWQATPNGAGTPPPAAGWRAGLSLGGGPLSSAPAVGVDSAGDEFVFWQGAGRGLWEKYYIGGKWSAPVQITSAGKIASAPAVAVRGVDQQDVFWKGFNGHLWEARYNHGWHTSVDLGAGRLASAPTVGVDPAGDEFVFWRGAASRLWEKSYRDGRWHRAVRITIAGKIGSAPAVAVHANGQADVFWKGTDGNLWEAVNSDGWHAPIDLGGGPLGSAPTAGVDSAGDEFVFWRGTDGGLWENFYLDSRWNSPIRITIAGTIDSAPAVAVHPTGQQDVFWRGLDGNLWESFYQPS